MLTEQEAAIILITLTYFPENLGKLYAFLESMLRVLLEVQSYLQNTGKDSEQTNGEEVW